MVLHLIERFDIPLFYLINNKLQNNLFDFLMPLITGLGNVYFITALGLFLLLFKKKDIKILGFLILSGLTVSKTVSTILKEIFSRPRPAALIENVNLLCDKSYINSFPSGHTTLAFTIAAIITSFYPRSSLILFALASCVGFSRIYVGAHFPTDVIAGAFLGIIIGKIIAYIWRQDFSSKEG